ncbi:peptidase inhibitor family I36 protein [Streptomyces gobiensis]|uniref:peptidase inhibitor family I36 protein n=1 Tax=Streptomyces gobiensis TaxID=2875706 RepID=UPI001E638D7E|nr:peptidase inhibitor family I36 protein [Streptomyces gobiensis]UGY90787.1 peptidase inhibitor family I36 protein [Streptomyces gobiensis]
MSRTRPRLIGALMVLALSSPLLGATTATAATATAATAAPDAEAAPSTQALQRAAAQCGRGEICFWRDRDFRGTPWRWMPSNGYRNMPKYLHDNVGSFYANAPGCFIDWKPKERRTVNSGDFSRSYKWGGKFGSRIDAVDRRC